MTSRLLALLLAADDVANLAHHLATASVRTP